MKYNNHTNGMKDFLLLWASQAVSSLGSSMTAYALILWVYSQNGTATSVSLLSTFTYLPSILFCFVAGTLADRWNKKAIMLAADAVAALGTFTVLILYKAGSLLIWHLYAVNFIISFMNAFQSPASYVAVSLIAPKSQYQRVGGLQALSGSIVSILTPAFGTAIMAFGGLDMVLYIDLATFTVAFSVLALLIHIPKLEQAAEDARESFVKSCMFGLKFLREHGELLKIILFFSFINLIAFMTGLGILPPMILSRSGGSQVVLGMVSSARGVGALIGGAIIIYMRPIKNRVRMVFASCMLAFMIENTMLSVGRTAWIWVLGAFLGEFCMPFLNANLTTIMRTNVPVELQGRVFSARDTLQYSTIPLGLFLGGVLADNVFEPLMAENAGPLSALVGNGAGAGMALMVFISGVIGTISCFIFLRDRRLNSLNK